VWYRASTNKFYDQNHQVVDETKFPKANTAVNVETKAAEPATSEPKSPSRVKVPEGFKAKLVTLTDGSREIHLVESKPEPKAEPKAEPSEMHMVIKTQEDRIIALENQIASMKNAPAELQAEAPSSVETITKHAHVESKADPVGVASEEVFSEKPEQKTPKTFNPLFQKSRGTKKAPSFPFHKFN